MKLVKFRTQVMCGTYNIEVLFLSMAIDKEGSSTLFRIFVVEHSGISLVKPDDANEKPYVLTKTKEERFI